MGVYGSRLAELSRARERAGRRAPGRRPGRPPSTRSAHYQPRDAAPPRRREVHFGTIIPSRYVAPPAPPPPPPPPDPDATLDEAKRGGVPTGMRTQALLFDRAAGWTVEKAKAWARKHGHKSDKVDVTDQYVRLRQLDPKQFTVKRTKTLGKGIRAVVAREENMKKKTARRPARKSTAKKPAHRAAPKRRPAKRRPAAKTRTVSARRRPYRAREAARTSTTAEAPRRVRETPVAAEARRKRKKSTKSYVMAKPRRRPRHKVRAWFGDSAGHSKAAKKGWKTRKGGSSRSVKPTKKAAESRRRPHRVRETPRTVQARRRPKHRHARETQTVQARRHPKRKYTREPQTVQARRRPKHRHARETQTVQARRRPTRKYTRESQTVQARRRSKSRRARETRVVRAPSFGSMARTAGQLAAKGAGLSAGYLIADAVDRFLATYDPAGASKPANKFTSDGTGTLANALNVASAPDLMRYGSLGALTLLPLVGSMFIKQAAIRSSIEGVGLGAGIKLAATLWSNVLMPLLVGKDTSVPALQKSWVARLYPAEVAATLNMKSGTAALSSASKAGTLSGGSDQAGVGSPRDAGPFALADRFGRREYRWVTPTAYPPVPDAPVSYADVAPGSVYPDGGGIAPAQPAWPAHWGERHRWGLRGVGAAVEEMKHAIVAHTGVHPAHAVNAAMHAAAEPQDLTLALRRALPHLRHELLEECARHVHPHLARMHAHARHPREHAEWTHARAAEGFPAPEHNAPEHEWQDWHTKREAAGLPGAPPPPELPSIPPPSPVHMRERHEWRPKSDREITYDRYATVQQAMGIGAGGPATSGNPGQPGLGDAFADAAQSAAAAIPEMPLENAVNVAANAAAEPFSCERAIERAMPLIRSELARYCAENMSPYIRQLHEAGGVPLPGPAEAPTALVVAPGAPALAPVIEFVPSAPPPGWTKSETEWHDEERRNWEHAHSGAHPAAVVAAATHAAEAAAAPHPDAHKPAVQAAVKAVADKAAQAASAAPPGTPALEVHAAATQAAQAATAAHPAVADHPAVQAAAKAAATAATATAEPKPAVAGVSAPPRHLQVGPTKLPHPQGPQSLQKECGCLDDSPYLGFVGDEVEEDLMYNVS